MLSSMVPFRMSAAGLLPIAYCAIIGILRFGWKLGLVAGALLVASLLMHEAGHMAAATALGVPVREFGLCLGGAYNRRAYALRRRDELLISAAGPMVNLLMAAPLLLIPVIGTQLSICNLALGIVNLFPLPGSDGLRILRIIRPPRPAADAILAISPPPTALAVPLA
jgi:Zn-dependent protease